MTSTQPSKTDGIYTASVKEKKAEASQTGFEIVHCEIWPTACCLKKWRTAHELFGAF